MGNSCFCDNIHFIKDVKLNVCFQRQDISSKSDQILIKDEDKLNTNDKNKEKLQIINNSKKKMNEILNYFNESEKEIINNLKKDRAKKIAKKKQEETIDIKENNKYELMLKRLLEQQNIKKNGPKRRETIRKDGDYIKDMVNNILKENKNDILNNKNNKNENNTLLISKKYDIKKGRFSVNIDRNTIFMNKLHNKKKIQEQIFKNRKTICAADILGEKNGLPNTESKDLINK